MNCLLRSSRDALPGAGAFCGLSLPGGVGFQHPSPCCEQGCSDTSSLIPTLVVQDGEGFPPCWVSVAELGVLGLVLAVVGLPRASVEQAQPRLQLGICGFELAWARVPRPSQRFSGASCPSSRRIFPAPMWKSISQCHHTAPAALPGLLLALQISKGFLGSLFPPSMLRWGFVFHSYLSLCRFVPVIAAVPGFPAGLLCRELQVGYEI